MFADKPNSALPFNKSSLHLLQEVTAGSTDASIVPFVNIFILPVETQLAPRSQKLPASPFPCWLLCRAHPLLTTPRMASLHTPFVPFP